MNDTRQNPLDLLKTPEPPRETPQKVLAQLGIAAAVLAVILGGYWLLSKRAYAVKLLLAEAAPLVERGDVPNLRLAEAKLVEAHERGGSDKVTGALAEVYALLWVEHGFADAKEKAREFTEDATGGDVQTAQRYVAEGLVGIAEGRLAETKQMLDNVLVRGAMVDRIYWILGTSEAALGDAKTAREHLRRAQDQKPVAAHYARATGDAADDAGDSRSASFAWEAGAKGNNAYVQGVARDLVAKLRRGDARKVIVEELKRLQALPPEQVGPKGQAAVHYAEATMFHLEGKLKDARKAIDAAITLGGETPRHLELRGRIQLSDGKADAGLKDLVAAHTQVQRADRYLYGLTDAYLELGKADEALKVLIAAGTTRAEDPDYHVALGNAYVRKADFAKAKQAFDKAMTVAADHPEAFLGLGVMAWKQRNNTEALQWFEKAVAAKPKFPEVYEAIGLMWAEQGALPQSNTQLDMGEKLFRASDVDVSRLKRFYTNVIKGYAAAKGGSSLAKDWSAREKAYADGTQPPLP